VVGAAAPEALRLYKIVTGRTSEPLPIFGRAYFLISVVFLALGGAVAVAWGEENPVKCLWIGMSLPVIISTFAGRPPTPPQ
jgi:hypothetical protein